MEFRPLSDLRVDVFCGPLKYPSWMAAAPSTSPPPLHAPGPQASLETGQACYLPCAPDSLPVIGAVPGCRGAYLATGHTCWGILNGPATGLLLAEMITEGRASSCEVAPFSPARFGGAGRGAAAGRV
jgi:hypothetical protein